MDRFVLILVYLFYAMNLRQFAGCRLGTDMLQGSGKIAVRTDALYNEGCLVSYQLVMKFVTYRSSLFWDVRWCRLVVVGHRRFGTMSVPSSRIKQ